LIFYQLGNFTQLGAEVVSGCDVRCNPWKRAGLCHCQGVFLPVHQHQVGFEICTPIPVYLFSATHHRNTHDAGVRMNTETSPANNLYAAFNQRFR